MTDTLPTVWEAEPHTLVKHAILRRYLQAWLPILTRQANIVQQQAREPLFIDGFAGPGEYKGGEPGSPVIAMKAALEHSVPFPTRVRMIFVEHRLDRFERLKTVIAPYVEKAAASRNIGAVEPRHGKCDKVLDGMLADFEKRKIRFGPALAFLDQFGYGEVAMDLIARILSFPQCEVFTYLSYKEMNRWITDKSKADAFTRAFGGTEWRECISLPERQRRDKLLDLYKSALKERAGAKYVVSFLMFDRNNVPLYWLLFCTNNIRGLEEMKKAMWKIDGTGEFRFSDRDNPDQLELLSKAFDDRWLADELLTRLGGKTMAANEIFEFVLAETPCYLFRGALKSLESKKDIVVVAAPAGRRPKTFPEEHCDSIKVRFEKRVF